MIQLINPTEINDFIIMTKKSLIKILKTTLTINNL